MPLRRRPQNLLLAAGASIVTFLIGEAIARIVWQPPPPETSIIDPDPVLGWSLRPGGRMHAVDSDRGLDFSVTVNSLGMRDRERTSARVAGTHRILVLGDSFVYGAGVEAEQRFTERLEREMGPDVELLNSGVGGWGTDQEYLFFVTRGLALRPDVVVLGVCLQNDVVNVLLTHALLATAPKPHCTVENGRVACQPPGPRPPLSRRRRLRAVLQH